MTRSAVFRWTWRLGLGLIGLVSVVILGGWLTVRSSLPRLDGIVASSELTAPVEVARDSLGVPTVDGRDRTDVAFALGFLHAQDRVFQMDLLRRQPAGELSELLGEGAVSWDLRIRAWRLRDVARQVVAGADPVDRAVLTAYASGVNAGIADLGQRPFEYLVLRSRPRPWTENDTVLVILSMYLELQPWGGRREQAWGAMRDLLPTAVFDFLADGGGGWDAPLVGPRQPPPRLPGPDEIDLRQGAGDERPGPAPADRPATGSNAWAVAGRLTDDGRSLLANDMHLGLAVPNIWYRARMRWQENGRTRDVVGVTLPGTPWLVVGSNSDVAWGFTNSYVDFVDVVILEPDPEDPERYLVPGGSAALDRRVEHVAVRGAGSREVETVWSRWGPVVATDHRGRSVAVHWVVHQPGGVNLGLGRLESATTLEAALDLGPACGIPGQNLVVAAADGRIGWTVAGRVPRRVGFDGQFPESWADGSRRWDGWYSSSEVPRVVDPDDGRIVTANNRLVGGAELEVLGNGGYDEGARAVLIRAALANRRRPTEGDMLAVQLDDHAVFLERWRLAMFRVLSPEAIAADPRRGELRRLVERWSGRAAPEDAGYRLVRAYRLEVRARALGYLTASCGDTDPCGWTFFNRTEGALWRLASSRPTHLLDPKFESWRDLFLASADAVIDHFMKDGQRLQDATWGARNRLDMGHPLAAGLPLVGWLLRMPPDPLPGDDDMPRVQSPTFGASERLVVSPGHEADGLFQMPGGQSGHPLSPFFRAGHDVWVTGEAKPLLPGPERHRLVLQPMGSASG